MGLGGRCRDGDPHHEQSQLLAGGQSGEPGAGRYRGLIRGCALLSLRRFQTRIQLQDAGTEPAFLPCLPAGDLESHRPADGTGRPAPYADHGGRPLPAASRCVRGGGQWPHHEQLVGPECRLGRVVSRPGWDRLARRSGLASDLGRALSRPAGPVHRRRRQSGLHRLVEQCVRAGAAGRPSTASSADRDQW